MASSMTFKRGDGTTKYFYFPAASWSSGGTLFFAAKQAFDDDDTDSLALIEGNWDDSATSDETVNGIAYKKYTCDFPPAATNSIESGGAATLELLGEFQWVPTDDDPKSFPADDENEIAVTVYMDIKRKIVP